MHEPPGPSLLLSHLSQPSAPLDIACSPYPLSMLLCTSGWLLEKPGHLRVPYRCAWAPKQLGPQH